MPQQFGKDIRQTTFIAAPIEKVYETITSAKEWDAFFTTGMELDPVPNGKMVWRWRNWGPNFYTTNAVARVIKAERPNLFVFQWYPVGKDNPTTISFKLTAKHGGTVVELTESGYPDTDQARAMILECACGWGEALTLLKFYIEHGFIYAQPKREGK